MCRYCGRDLPPRQPSSSLAPSPPQQAKPIPASRKTRKPKKPWLAAALNLFPLIMGLGYIYLGLWTRFIVVFAVQLFSLAPMTFLGLREYNTYLLAALWLFTLLDGYSQAKALNRRISRENFPSQ